MISVAKSTRINRARWRCPWTTKDGKTKGGFWYVRQNGKNVNLTEYGAPRQCKTPRDEKAANKARDKWLAGLRDEMAVDGLRQRGGVTCRQIVQNYLSEVAAHKSREYHVGAKRYGELFTEGHKGGNGITAYGGWGNLAADQITPATVQDWASCHNWGKAGFRNAVMFLKAAFNHAVRSGLIERNPVALIPTQRTTAEPNPFTAEEEKEFEAAAKRYSEAFYTLWRFCMDHGCRPSEATAATADHITKTPQGAYLIKLPPELWKNGKKGGSPKPRIIPIAPQWQEYIREREKEGGYIFRPQRAKKWTPINRERCMRVAREKAFMSSKSLYDCRHTFITRAIKAGVPIAKLAVICGTSTKEIEATYSHYLDEVDDMAGIMAALHNNN